MDSESEGDRGRSYTFGGNMKKYLIKKYIFTVVFIIVLYVLAIRNFAYSHNQIETNLNQNIKGIELDGAKSVIDASNKVIRVLDTSMCDNVRDKFNYVELYGYYNKILNKDEYNSFRIVKDQNGYLLYGNMWNFSDIKNVPVDEYIERVYKMQQAVKDKGTKVVVLGFPVKSISKYLNYKEGIPYQDYTSVADDYIFYSRNYNIPAIDLRIGLEKSNLQFSDMFFKTDHHWTPLAAFYAFDYMVDELKAMGIDLDPTGKYTDIHNYDTETYHECWLGSFGLETGINYVDKLEDITILNPKFDTNYFYRYRYSGDTHFVEEQGKFDQTLLKRKYIYQQSENNMYEGSAYNVYLNGICAYDHIENKNNPEGPKVLFIRDSYSSPLGAYFSSLSSKVDMIWSKGYGKDIEKLIRENDYDYIFVATWPENIADDSFNFYKE